MKKKLHSLFAITVALTTSIPASAATDFTNADLANSFISTAGNWSNGLPTPSGDPLVANPGTISIAAQFSGAVTHTGYNVVHSAGLLSLSGTQAFNLSGSTWLMNGTATINSRGFNLTNSSTFEIDLGSGTANVSNNNVDIVSNSSSSLTVTSGNLLGGRSLGVRDGGSFTMNSPGTVSFSTTTAYFGTNPLSGSAATVNLNAGSTSAARFALRGATQVNFGGSTAGSATFADWGTGLYTNTGDRVQDNNFTLNFKAATQMALTLGAAARALDFTNDSISNPTTLAWAEALWNRGQLIYTDGATVVSGADPNPETNGWTIVTWTDATNSGTGFGTASSEYFDWVVGGSFGGSLSIASSGGGDVTPPTWTATWPKVDTVGATTFTARAQTNENGTAYYVALADGASAPSAAEVKAGTAAGGGSALANGSISLTASTENTAAVTGLTAETAYDVYFVAEDAVPNLQASPSMVDVTTLAELTAYQAWATGGELFDADANGDGVDNGVAFLLGAGTPTSAVTLPTVSQVSENLTLTFSMLNSANRGSASLIVQHSSDLGIGDPWSAGATVPSNGGGVTFNVTPGSPLDSVIAVISSGEAASGKLFARLKAIPAP